VSAKAAIALRRAAAAGGLPPARRRLLWEAGWRAWSIVGARQPELAAQAQFEQAVFSYRLGHMHRAAQELAPLLEDAQAAAKVWLLYSRVLIALNMIPEAQAATERVAALDPAQQSVAYHRQVLPGLLAPAVRRAAPGGLLVAVGGGLGNMLHTGPLIANLARRTGRPVEVAVAEEQPGRLFLFNDPRFVSACHTLGQAVLARRYDTVLVTNCFGDLPVAFDAGRVARSLDWDRFSPTHRLHEAVFNLEAARVLLGVSHAPEDAMRYFVAEVPPPAGTGRRIGLHAGSKGGYWVAKRWPFFPALAAALQARGFEVASFGGPGEHVPGTLDLTGGSLRQMAEGLATCRYVVSNDSGVMNLAHALGLPLTALFGPTDARTRGPLRPGATALAAPNPCEATPEGQRRLREGGCDCIASLSLDRVLGHVLAELAAPAHLAGPRETGSV
ncbi:glycosyltransferase family 9 protein, partial [Roseomonas aerophila]